MKIHHCDFHHDSTAICAQNKCIQKHCICTEYSWYCSLGSKNISQSLKWFVSNSFICIQVDDGSQMQKLHSTYAFYWRFYLSCGTSAHHMRNTVHKLCTLMEYRKIESHTALTRVKATLPLINRLKYNFAANVGSSHALLVNNYKNGKKKRTNTVSCAETDRQTDRETECGYCGHIQTAQYQYDTTKSWYYEWRWRRQIRYKIQYSMQNEWWAVFTA